MSEPDMRRYAGDLVEMLRQRSPAAYRAFLARWRDMHEGRTADRLAKQSDEALRLRLERMILETPALADLHDEARAYVAAQGAQLAPAGQAATAPDGVERM